MKYRVLGPFEVLTDGGESFVIGADRQRAMLVALFARRGQVVSTDRLIDLLYDDDPDGGIAGGRERFILLSCQLGAHAYLDPPRRLGR